MKTKKYISIFLVLTFLFGAFSTTLSAEPKSASKNKTIDYSYLVTDECEQGTIVTQEYLNRVKSFIADFKSGEISNYVISNLANQETTLFDQGEINIETYYGPSYYLYQAVKYYQNRESDDWYDHTLYGSSNTIGAVGCALTSFTMMLNTNGWTTNNPDEENDFFALNNRSAASFSSGWGSLYSQINTCDMYFTVYANNPENDYTFSTSDIEEYMAADMYFFNKPYIVGLKKGTSTHFVLAWGAEVYGEDLSIRILDPWYPRDYSTLNQYYNAGWVMTSARLFR